MRVQGLTKMNKYKFFSLICLVLIFLTPVCATQESVSEDKFVYKKFNWDAQTKIISGSLAIYFIQLNEIFIMNFEDISLSGSNLYLWYESNNKVIQVKYKDFPLSLSNLFGWIDTINQRHNAEKLDISPILAVGEISIIKKDGKYSFMYSFYRADNYRFQWSCVNHLSEKNEVNTDYELWHGVGSQKDFDPPELKKSWIENRNYINTKEPIKELFEKKEKRSILSFI